MKNNNEKAVLIVLILALIIVLGGSWMTSWIGMGSMMNWMHGSWDAGLGFMWIFGWIFMILVIIALILLIAWIIKQLQSKK